MISRSQCVRRFALVVSLAWSATGLCAQSKSPNPIYSIADVEKPPAPKREIRIRYSRALRKEHGEITLRFVVTATGSVADLTVVKFSDPDMIDPVYAAYSDAEFSPALKSGKPVNARMEVTEVAQ